MIYNVTGGGGSKNYVDTQVSKASSPYNLLDNSDFLHFVAQAGIGGVHGTQAYAGDRWILDSGTVTGTANENSDGYSNITLTGTIRQKVASAPSVATVGIEMVSGTAAIAYADGEVTITSAGGVIRGAMLYEGEYTAETLPKYQPKGYGAELDECQKYYLSLTELAASAFSTDATHIRMPITLPKIMRKAPSIVSSQMGWAMWSNNGYFQNDGSVTATLSSATPYSVTLLLNIGEAGITSIGTVRPVFAMMNSLILSADL